MCFAAIGSCAGSCCMSCCCSSLEDCKVKHGPASRLPYIFLMFICCIFAIFMSLYGEHVLYSNSWLNQSYSLCEAQSCKGNGAVYRTSFTLFVFFIVHAILVYLVMSFHWLFFGIKFICLVVFLIGTFFIDGSFFDGYSSFARVASIVFLVLQVIVLLTWALDLNDRFVNKINELQNSSEETETKCVLKCYQCMIISVTVSFYAGIIILWVFFFQWFRPHKDCSFNNAMIIINILLVSIATILPVVLQTGSIFSTAIISVYMTYLCYSGLSSYPQEHCNVFAADRDTGSLWMGIIISAVAISYAGFSVSNQNLFDEEQPAAAAVELEVQSAPASSGDGDGNGDGDENDKGINESNYNDVDEKPAVTSSPTDENSKYKPEQKTNILFHTCMAFSAVYMCMLYTNWGTNTNELNAQALGKGKISLWVNISAEWIAFGLYLWVILAPKVCPQRFGIQSEE